MTTLRSAVGSNASIAAIASKGIRRKKKNVFQMAKDRLSDATSGAVDKQIRKRILGSSEITGEY